MLKFRKSTNKPTFHFGHGNAYVPFLFVQGKELALHSIVQLSETGSADSSSNGDVHRRICLDQDPLIDGEVGRSLSFG
jgi:hypothetical protein